MVDDVTGDSKLNIYNNIDENWPINPYRIFSGLKWNLAYLEDQIENVHQF